MSPEFYNFIITTNLTFFGILLATGLVLFQLAAVSLNLADFNLMRRFLFGKTNKIILFAYALYLAFCTISYLFLLDPNHNLLPNVNLKANLVLNNFLFRIFIVLATVFFFRRLIRLVINGFKCIDPAEMTKLVLQDKDIAVEFDAMIKKFEEVGHSSVMDGPINPLNDVKNIYIGIISRRQFYVIQRINDQLFQFVHRKIELSMTKPDGKAEIIWINRYFIAFYADLYETCISMGSSIAIPRMMPFTLELARLYVDLRLYPVCIAEISNHWKSTGHQLIKYERDSSIKMAEYMLDIASRIIVSPIHDDNDTAQRVLDEIYRNLGWLTEKVIAGLEVEVKPRMLDYAYSAPVDRLVGIFLFHNDTWTGANHGLDPMIFYDAMIVTIAASIKRRLSDCSTEAWLIKVEELGDAFLENIQRASKANDHSGVLLAALYLVKSYKETRLVGIKRESEKIVPLICAWIYLCQIDRSCLPVRDQDRIETIDDSLCNEIKSIPSHDDIHNAWWIAAKDSREGLSLDLRNRLKNQFETSIGIKVEGF